MDNANPVARQICQIIRDAIPVCATFGRGAMGVARKYSVYFEIIDFIY
jgi:hypothetical protein